MPYRDTPAKELECLLNHPRRKPLRGSYLWVLLDPDVRQVGDGIEHEAVYNGIVELWNRTKDGRIRNRGDLQTWVGEALDILVRCALSPAAKLLRPR